QQQLPLGQSAISVAPPSMASLPPTCHPPPPPNYSSISAELNDYHLSSSSSMFPNSTPYNNGLPTKNNGPYEPQGGSTVTVASTASFAPPSGPTNALFYAPSTATTHRAKALPMDQLHWQQLSKVSNERRTGLLPYLYPEGWTDKPSIPPPPSGY
ncbi:hypothetical protein KEM54_003213, partial [Ascosphaera aggregata]